MLEALIQRKKGFGLDICIRCAKNELHALVGPSGSGKTSTLRAIAGLTPVTGKITCNNEVWLDSENHIALKAHQRNVGFLFQQYALFPHLSVLENVMLPLRAQGLSDDTMAMHWLEQLGVASLANRYPSQISGGQQQRVALARALIRQPDVLLLDEPFSAVDAPTRQKLYESISELRQMINLPILLVTHDLNEAVRLADQITVIDAGLSLQTAAPQHLLDKPRNARIAELVGSPNLFHGEFDKGRLLWANSAIELITTDKGKIKNKTAVAWTIPSHSIEIVEPTQVHTYAKNLIDCKTVKVRQLGQVAVVYWQVIGSEDELVWQASASELRRLGIQQGSLQKIYLNPNSIHIMPIYGHRSYED